MMLRILKEHLPWVAPTTAIVLAATGVIDFGPDDAKRTEDISTFDRIEVSRNMTQNPVAPIEQGTDGVGNTTGSLAALQAVALRTPSLPAKVPAPVEPAVVAPTTPPVKAQKVSIEPQPTNNPSNDPAAFFAEAQANLEQDQSCVNDLRILADDARIYFPSGGLTAEDAGMEQARLIGLVAQDCPNVEIVVTGHSDPSGDPSTNVKLSQQRADAVVTRIASAGIDITRFQSVGLGSAQPSQITGDQPAAFYDRRVEFEIREISKDAKPSGFPQTTALSECAAQLQTAVAKTKLFYSPRSITVPSDGLPAVTQLAEQASACPDARLRVVGQFSDEPGSGESPATARLRAAALMSTLVGAGFAPEQIIIAAHSTPQVLAGQPGLSERRVDFDIVLEN